MKKYVRFITSSFLALWRSFAKVSFTKMKINVKTFSTAEAAVGKNSYCRYSTKWVFLKISQKFTGKHLCWSFLWFIKVNTYNFIKKGLQHSCFPVNVGKFLRRPFERTRLVSATVSVWAVVSENPLLKVCAKAITSAKNSTIFTI